jgi:hypothetical protein
MSAAGLVAGFVAWKLAIETERRRPWLWAIAAGLIVAVAVYELTV